MDRLLEADERRRSLTARVEELRAAQNRASKAIGAAQGEEKQQLIDEVAKVSAELKELEPELAAAEEDLRSLLAETPNVPHESAPDGFTDEDASRSAATTRNHRSSGSSLATTPSSARCSACSTPSAARGRPAPGSST